MFYMRGILQYRIVKPFLVNASTPTFGKCLCPVLIGLISKNPAAVVFAFKNKKPLRMN